MVQHRDFCIKQLEERARAGGGSGLRRRAADLGARCHAAAQGPLRSPSGLPDHEKGAAGHRSGLSRSKRPGESFDGIILGPPRARNVQTSTEIQNESLQQQAQLYRRSKDRRFSQFPSLPGASQGLPVQFAIKTTEPALRLNEVSRNFLDRSATKAACSCFIDTDLKYDLPQSVIEIDREKAAQLGLTMSQIGSVSRQLARRRLRQLLQHADAFLQA